MLNSVHKRLGLTFSVEIARQGGKNELSAHIELVLLTLSMASGGTLVKCSPTFKPQTIISMQRLRQRLNDYGFNGIYRSEMGYIISLGAARIVCLSAEESSSVVGHTADILLEVDESQDVSKEKYSKDFRPMGSSSNVTTVHYGTTWDDRTLLEEIKQQNLELERSDGIKRHFRYDWHRVAESNPAYASFVEAERERLGEQHPLFQTQYALLPISGGGGFLTRQQLLFMLGDHGRQRVPDAGRTYVAGIDLAGEIEREAADQFHSTKSSIDSTVISIAMLEMLPSSTGCSAEPSVKIVEQFCWKGTEHSRLYTEIVGILRRWNCRRVVVDATGIGQPIASFLKKELGNRVVPFVFTAKSKSELAFEFLSFVNSGRFKLYAKDGSVEYKETMMQLEKARSQFRSNRTMNFYVDPADGHDDFLISLALVVEAALDYHPRKAHGIYV